MKNEASAHKLNSPVALLFITSALCVSPLFGQVDAEVLRAKYGPAGTEVFELRPGIQLSVVYGENHQVCKLDLRPTRSASVVPAALIEELLNEIVPPSIRGTPGRQSVACSGAHCWKMADYENINIGQAPGDVTPNLEAPEQNSLGLVQVLVARGSPLVGQVDMLKAKYAPSVKEEFDVRPGIRLGIVYGENHQVCTLDIRPTPSAPVIPAALVEEIVNEVMPPTTRGIFKSQGVVCLGNCVKLLIYENLIVEQTADDVTPNPEAPVQNWLAVVEVKSCKTAKP